MNAPFGSLIEARSLAPLVMFVTGVVTIAEGASANAGLGAACLFGLGIPTIGTTAVAWLLVRRRWDPIALVIVGWAAAEAALAGVVGGFEGTSIEGLLAGAAVASAVTFVLAIPGWTFGAALAARKELDAGDTLLLWSSLWFGLLNVGYVAVFHRAGELVLPQVVIVVCAALFALTLTRAILRRRFYARIARGKEQGWSVREPSFDELAQLPPLFALGQRERAVIERRHVGGTTPYRGGGVLAEPFALVPVRG